ncbi:MAG: hypothetical protein PF482_19585 [Desulfobacteraceae bacterium]|jgi:hypothetical protein|nr:hypothetical protein [Desulfobacteraceae bacterium]
MDTKKIEELREIAGINQIIKLWKATGYSLKDESGSLQFAYAKGCIAFRIKKSPPRIVIYSGKNEKRRGSPLIKGAIEADKKKLKDYGFSSNTPDWKKDLTGKESSEFYVEFISYAINACKR